MENYNFCLHSQLCNVAFHKWCDYIDSRPPLFYHRTVFIFMVFFVCIFSVPCVWIIAVLIIILFIGIFLCSIVTGSTLAQPITSSQSTEKKKKKNLANDNLTSKILWCNQRERSCEILCCFMFPSLRNHKWLPISPQNKIHLLIWHSGPSSG